MYIVKINQETLKEKETNAFRFLQENGFKVTTNEIPEFYKNSKYRVWLKFRHSINLDLKQAVGYGGFFQYYAHCAYEEDAIIISMLLG